MSFLANLFNKEPYPCHLDKSILQSLLSNMSSDTRLQVNDAFSAVDCNFEFAVPVNMSRIQQHMDEGNQWGFMMWCNEDGKTAVVYGAGIIDTASFTGCMNWINEIHLKNDAAIVHFLGEDGEKVVQIE